MPTTTANALPIPLDSDPFGDGATAIRALGVALDGKRMRKPADEAVASSTALQNDDHLLFTVEAGKSYVFDLVLIFVAGASSSAIDAKVGFSFPGAAGSLTFGTTALDPATASGLGQVQIGGVAAATSGVSAVGVGVAGGVDSCVRVSGSIAATAAGTVRLMWAQNTASASSMTLKAGSTLQAWVTN